MKLCENCSLQNWCRISCWFGSFSIQSRWNFIHNNKKNNCVDYKRQWWKFWIKEE